MDHLEAINSNVRERVPHEETVRKVYLTYPSFVFVGKEDLQYEIFNEVSMFFGVPLSSVHVTGSGQIGVSLHKKTRFTPKVSDLDIAIVDSSLFLRYMEIVSRITNGYRDNTRFPIDVNAGGSVKEQYLSYLSKGIFMPKFMPACKERNEVNSFFGELSTRHSTLFKSISAGVYISELFFAKKQKSALELHEKGMV